MAKKTGAAAAADAKDVKAAHAKTGRPVSPTEDPTDHSTSAASIAASTSTDPKAKAAAANAEKIDAINKTATAKEAEDLEAADTSLVGKIRKSELFWVNDHVNGGGPYVGISPQNDPKASDASKRLSAVHPLTGVAPKTGLRVVPKDGEAFVIGEGFGPDSDPSDWAKVTSPDGKPLFA